MDVKLKFILRREKNSRRKEWNAIICWNISAQIISVFGMHLVKWARISLLSKPRVHYHLSKVALDNLSKHKILHLDLNIGESFSSLPLKHKGLRHRVCGKHWRIWVGKMVCMVASVLVGCHLGNHALVNRVIVSFKIHILSSSFPVRWNRKNGI